MGGSCGRASTYVLARADGLAPDRFCLKTAMISAAHSWSKGRARERNRLEKAASRVDRRVFAINHFSLGKSDFPELRMSTGASSYLNGICAGLQRASHRSAHCSILTGGVNRTRRKPKLPPWANTKRAPSSFDAFLGCMRFLEWHPVQPKLPLSQYGSARVSPGSDLGLRNCTMKTRGSTMASCSFRSARYCAARTTCKTVASPGTMVARRFAG
jgi:hypothetical protein